MAESLARLLDEVRACRECAKQLPLGPRPVVQIGRRARVVVVGQAPGAKVHESGVPWDDDSGAHLREWLGVDKAAFYDASKLALMPMAFCYPGKAEGGDLPPRPECAPLWHDRLLRQMKDPLLLLVGQFAQARYLKEARKGSLTETVRCFEEYLPRFFPLPHPSWRSKLWMKKNPWFGERALPRLQELVAARCA